MEILIFSQGEWIEVSVPSSCSLKPYLYGTMYASLTRDQGKPEKEAVQLAEAAVFKQLYPGLVYSHEFEKKLSEISR